MPAVSASRRWSALSRWLQPVAAAAKNPGTANRCIASARLMIVISTQTLIELRAVVINPLLE
jgi:hypothetical protein